MVYTYNTCHTIAFSLPSTARGLIGSVTEWIHGLVVSVFRPS